VTLRLRCDFPCTLWICALAIAATAGAFDAPRLADALVADGRIADGQLWRALTGPLVHATWGHLVRDLALVAIAGVAYEAPLGARRGLLFAAGLVVPPLAVLMFGGVSWYCGLSGLSHALLAAALSYELVCRRGAARAIVVALCAVSAAKPIYELVTGQPAFAMPLGDGVVQAPLAHVAGCAVGIACGLLAGRDRRRLTRVTPLRSPAAPCAVARSAASCRRSGPCASDAPPCGQTAPR
jgi:rhomboid family GlyGly-CTERM serine protease